MTSGFCVRCGGQSDAIRTDGLCTQCGDVGDRVVGRTFPAEGSVPVVWEPGDRLLDVYDVRGVLGVGGMGSVYRVHHRGWDLDMAVKSPLPDVLAAAGGGAGFVAEADAWVGLGLHPHVVSCYFVRTLGGVPRVFTELVEGGSLRDWIASGRLYEGLPTDALTRVLDVAIQTAWGLGYAHEVGLVHQDVKPANVLLTADRVVKVTDFGLASVGAVPVAGADGAPTGVAAVGGTPAFVSPEQADAMAQARAGVPTEQRTRLTRRSDLWSWALCVLDMFTGTADPRRPGHAAASVLSEYLRDGPGRPDLPPMPAVLATLLGQCFVVDPDDRPRGMYLVAERLADIYADSTGEPYPRRRPVAAELAGDSLNNRALSRLELGHREDAMACWEQALAADPDHTEAVYNHGLLQWRAAQITDVELVGRLERVIAAHPGDWRPGYLLARVHGERGDPAAARLLLEQAAEAAPNPTAIRDALRDLATGDGFDRILTGPGAWVTALAVTSSGRVVSGAADGTVRVWDLASGQCVHTLAGRVDLAQRMAVTPDSQHVVGGGDGGMVRVWELASGRCVQTLGGHSAEVGAVTTTPDGRYVVGGGDDGTVRVWELASGRSVHTLAGYTSPVAAVTTAQDGRYVVSGSADGAVRVWELTTGVVTHTLKGGDTGRVWALAVTPDGRQVVSGSADDSVRLWDTVTGRCVRTVAGHTLCAVAVAVTPDGRQVVSGSGDGTVRVWDLTTGRAAPLEVTCPNRPVERSQNVGRAVEAADRALALGAPERAFDLVEKVRRLPGYDRHPRLLALRSAAGRRARTTGLTRAWSGATLTGHAASVTAVAATSDGRHVVSGSADCSVRVWDLATGRCVQVLSGHTSYVRAVAVAPDGRHVVSGGDDGSVRVWDLATGRCVHVLSGHTSWVRAVAVAPDGRHIVSGGDDESMRVWDLATGRCVRTLPGHMDGVGAVAVTPDGRHVVCGSDDHTVRVWDLATGTREESLSGHTNWVRAVAVTPDGGHIVSGSTDGSVRVWDSATGRCVQVLSAHMGDVGAVAVTPDGRHVVSGSDDHTVRVWDLATGTCEESLSGHTSLVQAVTVTPHGSQVVSGGFDETVRVWGLEWEYEFPDPADWDEGARPYLEIFLTLHTAAGPDGLTRAGALSWSEHDVLDLLAELGRRGYGWLRPAGVRANLDELAVLRRSTGVPAG